MNFEDPGTEKPYEENDYLANEKKKDPGEVARELLDMAKNSFKSMSQPPQVVGYAAPQNYASEFAVRIIENGYILTYYYEAFHETTEVYATDDSLDDEIKKIVVLLNAAVQKRRKSLSGGPLGR